AAAHAFYTQTLGFETLMAMPEANLFIVQSAGTPGLGLLLEPSNNPVAEAYRRGVYEQGLPAIVFGSADVRADYDRLTAAGVVFQSEPAEGPAGLAAVFDDTFGNYVQLHQD
ncbi:MAG: glyoxalase, partial [Sinomonas sp.]|nr:glyoxalase [Sinomonas sp.]